MVDPEDGVGRLYRTAARSAPAEGAVVADPRLAGCDLLAPSVQLYRAAVSEAAWRVPVAVALSPANGRGY